MPIKRRHTTSVSIGRISIGGDAPICIQSMTNTLTSDIQSTVDQIKELANAGSELIRITINDDAAAQAVPEIYHRLHDAGITVPLIGDFHFNGHTLLSKYPEMARLLSKYRINPGNLGHGDRHDAHFETIIKIAVEHNTPVRIGVNGGSLDPDVLAELMNHDHTSPSDKNENTVFCEAMVQSALRSAEKAMEFGLRNDQIILSAKTSNGTDLIQIYQALAECCHFPLHLGLTEAGSGHQGIIASTAAMSVLLQQGIGDTIRVSLTPDQNTHRTTEVLVAQQILQALGIRYFEPRVISCPGCGRTSPQLLNDLSQSVRAYIHDRLPEWSKKYPGVNRMTVAAMGCVVNGPGESRHADIGLCLPGKTDKDPAAPVYIRGQHMTTLRGPDLDKKFLAVLENFVQTTYS